MLNDNICNKLYYYNEERGTELMCTGTWKVENGEKTGVENGK